MQQTYRSDMTPHPSDKNWDVIVVGSGLGGMTTATLLAKAGRSVLLLERHTVPGGFTHTFKRKGYEWDVGVHYVGQATNKNSIPRRVFDYVTDGKLEWADMGSVYDEVVIEGDHYKYVSGVENQIANLLTKFPEEEVAIRKYYRLIQSTAHKGPWFFGEKTMPFWMSRLFGWMLRRPFEKQAAKITADVMNDVTQNERLLSVLTAQCGNYGLEPSRSSFGIHAVVADHYVNGAAYPVGGAAEIPNTVLAEFDKFGGTLLVKADVEEILVERNRAIGVKLQDGKVLRARTVVSNAGFDNTFSRLVRGAGAGANALPATKKVEPSTSHLCLYVGLDCGDLELGLPKNNIWVYPSYDMNAMASVFRKDPSTPFPVVYISFPSAKDPKRNPSKATIQVIAPYPFDAVENWDETKWHQRGEAYDMLKAGLKKRLTDALEKAVPQVKGHIAYSELSTPLSTKHFSNYQHGEIYGLEHTPERFAFKALRPRTKIKALFLTGQDIVTVGVAGALYSGVLTATAVLNRSVILRILLNRKL